MPQDLARRSFATSTVLPSVHARWYSFACCQASLKEKESAIPVLFMLRPAGVLHKNEGYPHLPTQSAGQDAASLEEERVRLLLEQDF